MSKGMKTCALLTGIVIAATSNAAFAEVFSGGHGDVGGAFEDGSLRLELHLDDLGVELPPEQGVILMPATTREFRPAAAAYDAIGTAAGGFVFKLSQSSFEAEVLDGSPFLGIATEEIPAFTFTSLAGTHPASGIGRVRLELLDVSGPGHFSIWRDFPGGPGWETRPGYIGLPMASSDGVDPAADFIDLPTGIHEHENWAFTAAGTYNVTFRLSGDLLSGGSAVAAGTYTFQVVPEPRTWLLVLNACLTVLGALSHRNSLMRPRNFERRSVS